jgi:hypothetical protein
MRLSNAIPQFWSVIRVSGQPIHSWMHQYDLTLRPRRVVA